MKQTFSVTSEQTRFETCYVRSSDHMLLKQGRTTETVTEQLKEAKATTGSVESAVRAQATLGRRLEPVFRIKITSTGIVYNSTHCAHTSVYKL
jgi:hypothetical protein